MALEQKIVRAYSEFELDIKVNKLLLEGWERSGDVRLFIKQRNYQNGSDNEEVWYQTLSKYNEES